MRVFRPYIDLIRFSKHIIYLEIIIEMFINFPLKHENRDDYQIEISFYFDY